MKKLLLLLLFIPLMSFGQKSNDADALKLCVALQTNNFTTDSEAEDAVNKILSVIGASQKPILQACSNINNAVAAVYKGQRYILYDRDFMNSLTEGSNKYWSNMFVLAHEMGHHINGHSLDIILYASDIIDPKSLEERRLQELEADEFAGFVLAKLGATLSQASKVISNLPKISNENLSTHPSKDKRISSVKKGFGDKDNYNIENRRLKYSIVSSENKYDNTGWDNVLKKVKEKELDSITDPFERLKIIDDYFIPDLENHSWVYGKILKNDLIQYKEPQFLIIQQKYDGKEFDPYNDVEIIITNPYFLQKLEKKFPKDIVKYFLQRIRKAKNILEYEFVFDDGYSGKIESDGFGQYSPFYLTLDRAVQNDIQSIRNLYSIFLKKLQTQKKLFLRLSKYPANIGYYEKSTQILYSIQNDWNYEDYVLQNPTELIKTIEFDLTGSSEALSF